MDEFNTDEDRNKGRYPHWSAFFPLSDLLNREKKNPTSPPGSPLILPHLLRFLILWALLFFTLLPLCPCMLSLSIKYPIDCLNASKVHITHDIRLWKISLVSVSFFTQSWFSQFEPDAYIHSSSPAQAQQVGSKMLPRQKTWSVFFFFKFHLLQKYQRTIIWCISSTYS